MKWFRFYHDALDDPKVQLLSDRRYRQWVNLLCLASQNEERGQLPDAANIAFRLRIDAAEAEAMMADFIAAGLIDVDDDGNHGPHNWNGRQRASDDVASRVTDYRERKASSNGSNVTETADVTLHEPTLQRSSRARADTDAELDPETEPEPEKPPRARARMAAAQAGDVELSPEEREVIAIVQQVPGLSGIPPSEVALHLRDALSCRDGPPLTFRTLKAEALKFRDFWTDRRGTATTGKWRGWQNAITNWFTRAKELPTFEIASQNGQTDDLTATERSARERDELGRALAAAGIIPNPERSSSGAASQRAAT